jgi:SAM-dependent methyltransferase
MNLRTRVLAHPVVYRSFKRLIARSDAVQTVVEEHFVVEPGSRVLDVGCGFGDYAQYFESDSYLGIDHNAEYLDVARSMNPDKTFIVADVADEAIFDRGPFDLVFLSGVLHHLSDDQITQLAKDVSRVLSPGGRFVALEPYFHDGQRLTARLLIAADRGQFVRDERGYRTLLEPAFEDVASSSRFDLLRTPYSHLILEARSSGA